MELNSVDKSSTSNGMKQGGCLSPNLFSVYLKKVN